MHEIEVTRRYEERVLKDTRNVNFISAGAYQYYVPESVTQPVAFRERVKITRVIRSPVFIKNYDLSTIVLSCEDIENTGINDD